MKTSEKAIQQIAQWEGVKLKMYICVAGCKTIGVGHVILPHEQELLTKELTYDEAMGIFKKDLETFEHYVNAYFKGGILTQPQFDAAVPFAFNAGIGNLKKSSWARLLSENKIDKAAESLALWGQKQWKTAPGLKRRRFLESQWLKGAV